jgi:rare lipoprotein A
MRRRMILRRRRVMRATVGAMILGVPASAAFADAPHGAQVDTAGDPSVKTHVQRHRIGFGRSVVVTGRAPASEAGQTVTLDFEASGTGSWQQLASGQIGSGGSFRLSAPLHGSGWVKTATSPPASTSTAFTASAASSSSTTPERVVVAAGLHVSRRNREVLGSGTFAVRGQLLPRSGGRRVVLQARRGGRWITLAGTRTGSAGRFGFRYHADAPGRQALRVRFAGDRYNAAASASAGRVVVLRQSIASWYDDAGTTGCGFHAYYGVANVSLPCGTRVSFRYGGRTVTATVDDRGPYVGGREWDLNQNTAAALGFGGVGAVWVSS